MRYALISDIHSNLEALTAVMRDMQTQTYDTVVCLGDVVGYGPNPNECMDLVWGMTAPENRYLGNHDEFVTSTFGLSSVPPYIHQRLNPDAAWGTLFNAQLINAQNRERLTALTTSKKYSTQVGNLLFAHSTPLYPEVMDYIFGPAEARKYFFDDLTFVKDKITAFVGHIHVPQVYYLNPSGGPLWGGRIFPKNPYGREETLEMVHSIPTDSPVLVVIPSVGQPRDGISHAGYALFDTESRELKIRRIPYDIDITQAKMRVIPTCPVHLITRLTMGK